MYHRLSALAVQSVCFSDAIMFPLIIVPRSFLSLFFAASTSSPSGIILAIALPLLVVVLP